LSFIHEIYLLTGQHHC